jgi:hypothetical protein
MPQATNLVLKNAADVDKTFALAAPAAGTSSAVWFLREGANQSVFPKIEISGARASSGPGRKTKTTLKVPVPVTDSNGVVRSGGDYLVVIDATAPDSVPDGTRDDAIAYIASLVAATLWQETAQTGYAPT